MYFWWPGATKLTWHRPSLQPASSPRPLRVFSTSLVQLRASCLLHILDGHLGFQQTVAHARKRGLHAPGQDWEAGSLTTTVLGAPTWWECVFYIATPCSNVGSIPNLFHMTALMDLDVSFNNLGTPPPAAYLPLTIANLILKGNNLKGGCNRAWAVGCLRAAKCSYIWTSARLCCAGDPKLVDSQCMVTAALGDVVTGNGLESAGSMPDYSSRSSLDSLDLSNNQLSGKLPARLPSNIYIIDLSSNKFSGEIDEFGETSASFLGCCQIRVCQYLLWCSAEP